MSSTAASDSSPAPLALHLFGVFEASVHGAPLPRLRSCKGQWLLALLALHAGQEVERTWLAALLWPASSERAGLANLRTSLKDLRRALGPQAARLCSPTSRTLCLDLAGAWGDVLAFDAAIARGDAISLQEAAVLGRRGPLLERWSAEWVFLDRQRREQAYLAALETLAAQARAAGNPGTAERWLRQAVAVDPLRETAQRSLMEALAASGNYGAALWVYRELRQRLHREINAEPDAETLALFAQIRREGRAAQRAGHHPVRERGTPRNEERGMRHEEDLPPPALIPPGARPPGYLPKGGCMSASQPKRSFPVSFLVPELPAALLRQALKRGRMVGRDAERSELERRIEAARGGEGGVVLLAGEPGIGKTRLATEGCALARRQGFRVLTGRCDEAGAAPYQPFVEALREHLNSASPEEAEETLPPPVACELVRLVPRVTEKSSPPTAICRRTCETRWNRRWRPSTASGSRSGSRCSGCRKRGWRRWSAAYCVVRVPYPATASPTPVFSDTKYAIRNTRPRLSWPSCTSRRKAIPSSWKRRSSTWWKKERSTGPRVAGRSSRSRSSASHTASR